MSNRYTLKVYPVGQGRSIYRVLTIDGEESLDHLCDCILDAFDFDHDHLYEYCLNNKMYRGDTIPGPHVDDNDDDLSAMEISLDNLNLVKGRKFSLHYDFGDDWMFPILVQKIEEADQRRPVSIVKSKGTLEQYPSYDGDEDEWE